MILKQITLLFILLISCNGLTQKSYKKVYSVKLSGTVTDENKKPIPNATIKTIFNLEPVSISAPILTEIQTDSLGNYELLFKKNGRYIVEFIAEDKISYRAKCLYSKKMQENIRKREYDLTFNVQLFPKSKKVRTDIYNGGEFLSRRGELAFTPYKRYLQAHDYKARNGLKSSEKLVKYITKRFKKLQLSKILGVMASRPQIDTIIKNEAYDYEVRKRWARFFGKSYPDFDKKRLELIQDFFNKISQKDDNGTLIYHYESHILDLTKTMTADDTKKVFKLYRFKFSGPTSKPLSCDLMLIKTLSGWKINYLSENY